MFLIPGSRSRALSSPWVLRAMRWTTAQQLQGRTNLGFPLPIASNVLGANVAIANGSYTDGPSMAQGSTGTWGAFGSVTITDSIGAARLKCKLWDGTTILDSTEVTLTAATFTIDISLFGILAVPAGNIRMSCQSNSATSSFVFNQSGSSKDCQVVGYRLA